MTEKKLRDTVGITLRVDRSLFDVYASVAKKANMMDLQRGGEGRITTQSVMRHRLASLPVVKLKTNGKKRTGTDEN